MTIDDDFSGYPDDLFQLVHHALSPAVEIPLVGASHLRPCVQDALAGAVKG